MTEVLSDGIVHVESCDDGAFWRITLNDPPANHLDEDMIAALTDVFERARAEKDLRATVLMGAGDNFSLGGSPESFLPERAAKSVPAFINLIRLILDTTVARVAIVRGECMGRGLELARICNRVYASMEARVGLPEIEMGVIPAVACIVLPERLGRGPASEMCATGYIKGAEEASWMQLVDHAVEDVETFAIAEVRQFLSHLSVSSLRLAFRAVDIGFCARVKAGLDAVEKFYLEEVLPTHDAEEGVRAAIENRKPIWKNE